MFSWFFRSAYSVIYFLISSVVKVMILRCAWGTFCFCLTFLARSLRNKIILKRLKGRWAIITGCTDGIGLGIAQEMAAQKINLILISRSQEKLQLLEKDLSKNGIQIQSIAIDYKQEIDFKQALSQVKHKEKVDVLVNNVGMAMMHLPNVLEYTQEQETDLIKVNQINTLRITREYLTWNCKKTISENSSETENNIQDRNATKYVLIVGSMLGLMPSPCMQVYAGTKAFLQVWTESVAAELHKGVHFEVLMTGLVVTKLSKVKRPGIFTPSSSLYGKLCVHSFGLSTVTYPYIPHWVQALGIEIAPRWFMAALVAGFSVIMRKKIAHKREKIAAEKAHQDTQSKQNTVISTDKKQK